MCGALLGLLEYPAALVLAETSADGAGLLGSEVEGEVFLFLVEEAELRALVGVNDGEDFGDRLADIVAMFQLVFHYSYEFSISQLIL